MQLHARAPGSLQVGKCIQAATLLPVRCTLATSHCVGMRERAHSVCIRATPEVSEPMSEDVPAQVPQQLLGDHNSGKTGNKVVCVGEALYDLIADQKGLKRDEVKSWTPYAGGAPANVATSLARLGVNVTFVTALGNDELGQGLTKICKERGVRLHAVQQREEPTRSVYVVRDIQGDREFAGFGLPADQYSDCFIQADKLPAPDIQAADVLLTGTLGLAYPDTAKALNTAVDLARAHGTTVFVDVNWRPVFWPQGLAHAKAVILEYLQRADIIKLSDQDLEALLAIDLTPSLLNPCMLREYFPHARGILVTAGSEGAAYCFKTHNAQEVSGFVPAYKVEVVDTTGAGDAFTAGFIYKMLSRRDNLAPPEQEQLGSLDALASEPSALKEAVVFAAAAGAATCKRAGAIEGQPTLAEAQELYEEAENNWYNFW